MNSVPLPEEIDKLRAENDKLRASPISPTMHMVTESQTMIHDTALAHRSPEPPVACLGNDEGRLAAILHTRLGLLCRFHRC